VCAVDRAPLFRGWRQALKNLVFDEPVAADAKAVRTKTRPPVVLRSLHDVRSHGIQIDVLQASKPLMLVFNQHGLIPPVPDRSDPLAFAVVVAGVLLRNLADAVGDRRAIRWRCLTWKWFFISAYPCTWTPKRFVARRSNVKNTS
jgi:hypothetical protein